MIQVNGLVRYLVSLALLAPMFWAAAQARLPIQARHGDIWRELGQGRDMVAMLRRLNGGMDERRH